MGSLLRAPNPTTWGRDQGPNLQNLPVCSVYLVLTEILISASVICMYICMHMYIYIYIHIVPHSLSLSGFGRTARRRLRLQTEDRRLARRRFQVLQAPRHMEVSKNGGPQNRPQYMTILSTTAPKLRPPRGMRQGSKYQQSSTRAVGTAFGLNNVGWTWGLLQAVRARFLL